MIYKFVKKEYTLVKYFMHFHIKHTMTISTFNDIWGTSVKLIFQKKLISQSEDS